MECKTRIIVEFVECMEMTLSIRKFLLPLQHKAYKYETYTYNITFGCDREELY